MLSQEDRQRLNEIEQRLLADDPRFVARMRSTGHRPGTAAMVLLFLWAAALAAAVLARSILLIIALGVVILLEAGWRLYRRRRPLTS